MSLLESMTMPRNLAGAMCAALALATGAVVATPAFADSMLSEQAPSRSISVPRDKSLSFRLDQPASKIVVAQPDIAEVVATTDRSFYVRGVDVGSTNLLVYDLGGRLMDVIDVRVGVDAAALQQDIARAMPKERIRVQPLGDGVLLTGDVTNAGVALRAKAIAEKFAPDLVTSMLKATDSQVVLEVRILEADRNVAQDLGLGAIIQGSNFNFTFGSGLVGSTTPAGSTTVPLVGLVGSSPASGALRALTHLGSATIDAQVAALEQKGLVRTLARPDLVAMSGEKATFLAGGEFPFPVPTGLNNVTIEFRPYGVKLNFTPTVQDDGTIRLVVEPEVSALDTANTLRLNGTTVPALTIRRTTTTVELKNGESLKIGGLFQRSLTNQMNQIPGLGEIPILSALFRSTHWQRNETELLIIVTPRIVRQSDYDAAKHAEIAGTEPSVSRLLLNGEVLDKPIAHDMNGPVDVPNSPQKPGLLTPTNGK
jgi:pilus assembly protein CpaC